jgi:hypothetical protein
VAARGARAAAGHAGRGLHNQIHYIALSERSDFGLYSRQSRPWLNTPAAWLTRLETPLALVGADFDVSNGRRWLRELQEFPVY